MNQSTPLQFLESEFPSVDPSEACFHILPVPLERTVSYGKGTADGPQAIIEASQQLEAFDGKGTPGDMGMHTLPPVDCHSGSMQEVLHRIQNAVIHIIGQQKIPVLLGGEHSLTQAPANALKELGRDFGVVQIDAHADLRNAYEGSTYSHACVMRRIVENDIPILQCGVRSLSAEEARFRRAKKIPHRDAEELHRAGAPADLVPEGFPTDIYLTVDVDGLDPAIIPATGTPEPGGLDWYTTLDLIEHSLRGRRLLGFDVVELAPMQGQPASNFIAAKLVYAIMGIAQRGNAV